MPVPLKIISKNGGRKSPHDTSPLRYLSPALFYFVLTSFWLFFQPGTACGQTISFGGYNWVATSSPTTLRGPGKNYYAPGNVFLDANGYLHMKITNVGGNWYCAEIEMFRADQSGNYTIPDSLGAGTYQFQVEGALDKMGPSVVLGMYNYSGHGGWDEQDIEWGKAISASNGLINFTARAQWGYDSNKVTTAANATLSGTYTTNIIHREYDHIDYSVIGGFYNYGDNVQPIFQQTFYNTSNVILSKTKMPILVTLWLHDNNGDGVGDPPPAEVEIIIHSFKFTPDNCQESYEPNDQSATASPLVTQPLATTAVSKTITSPISTASDQDWYSIPVSGNGNLNLSLTNLPADYDMELYPITGSGSLALLGSYNSGTTAESLSYNYQTPQSTEFYVKVYPKDPTQYNACKNYSLNLNWTPSAAACTTPAPPTPTFGASTCSASSSVTGAATTALTFTSNGGVQYKAQVSQYPYGSANIIYNPGCQSGTNPFQAGPLTSGMLYRWNMYALGSTDCTSCESTVSTSGYFSLPPTINANSYSVQNGQYVTLNTVAQAPGTGASVNYRWLKDGQTIAQGPQQTSYTTNQAGSYTLVIDYSGSQICTDVSSTPQSNIIILSSSGNGCMASVAPSAIIPNTVNTANGTATQLSLSGGALGTNAKWEWYAGSCGGTLIDTTASITVNPTATTTYYVQATGDCGTTACLNITVNGSNGCVSSTPPDSIKLSYPGIVYNGLTAVTLTPMGGALAPGAHWVVYQNACGGTPVGIGGTYNDGTAVPFTFYPAATTTYYFRAEGCDTSICVSKTVVVNNCSGSILPDSIHVSNPGVTYNGINAVDITPIGGKLATGAHWVVYQNACGGTPVGIGGTYTDGTSVPFRFYPSVTTTYYIRAEGCDTTNCVSKTVNVAACPGSLPPDSISVTYPGTSYNGIKAVELTPIGGKLPAGAQWVVYNNGCGEGPSVGIGGTYTDGTSVPFTFYPSVTTTYYIRAEGCDTSACVSKTVTVDQPPTISSLSTDSARAGDTVLIYGTNFMGVTNISFGGAPARSFVLTSSSLITAVVDTGSTGAVVIKQPSGTASFPGFKFIFTLPANNFQIQTVGETCAGSPDGGINITAQTANDYLATLSGNGRKQSFSFTQSQAITGLDTGQYQLCITIGSEPGFVQCYMLKITEPQPLSVYSTINPDNTLTLHLRGSNLYTITLNQQSTTTTDSVVTLKLINGQNSLTVTTDKLCQGTYQEVISILNQITPFPNPFETILNVNIGKDPVTEAKFTVYDVSSAKLFFTKQLTNVSGIIPLDLSNLKQGIYALHVSLDRIERVYKIIKQ